MEPSVSLGPSASSLPKANVDMKPLLPTILSSPMNPHPVKSGSPTPSNRKQTKASKMLPSLKDLFPLPSQSASLSSTPSPLNLKTSKSSESYSRQGRFSPYPKMTKIETVSNNNNNNTQNNNDNNNNNNKKAAVLPPFSSVVSRTTICKNSPSNNSNNTSNQNTKDTTNIIPSIDCKPKESSTVEQKKTSVSSDSYPSKPHSQITIYPSPKNISKINDGQWSEKEHSRFLEGLKVCGRGKWRAIADDFVKTRTRIQVASHAQKYFMKKQKEDS